MVMRHARATEHLDFVVFQVGATGAPVVVAVTPE
jgi:hypothetical protein